MQDKQKMSDLAKSTKKQLFAVCSTYGLRRYSQLNKTSLIKFIEDHVLRYEKAVVLIQRWIRRISKNWHEYQTVNDIDFVTLEPIESAVVFKLRNRSNKQTYIFDPRNLMKYILDCGKFINPFTREALSDLDIKRLQHAYLKTEDNVEHRLSYQLGPQTHRLDRNTDLVQVKISLQRVKQEEHQREELFRHLQENCTDVVNTIFDMILYLPSRDVEVIAQVMTYIINYHFTQFLEHFQHQLQVDSGAAQHFFHQIINRFIETSESVSDTLTQRLVLTVKKLFLAQYNELFHSGAFVPYDINFL
jgi:hypothetical protein